VSYDRYKTCRRHCSILRALLEQHKELLLEAKEYFESKKKDNTDPFPVLEDTKFLGENLPDNTLGCMICNFIAKSPRGLKIHLKRTHKIPSKEL
jgi:hypothetical protein